MEIFLHVETWVSLVTLTFLEIVLGIENVMPPNPYRKESYDEVSVAALKTARMETSFYDGFEFEYADLYVNASNLKLLKTDLWVMKEAVKVIIKGKGL